MFGKSGIAGEGVRGRGGVLSAHPPHIHFEERTVALAWVPKAPQSKSHQGRAVFLKRRP
jgi:hypothetical protein